MTGGPMTSLFDRLTYEDVAKTIDHSLLRPELDDQFIEDGCVRAADSGVPWVSRRPADVPRAVELLRGTGVAVGTVIGFPHGGTTTEVKLFEAEQALRAGAIELDMVINIGALRSGRDAYMRDEIAAVVAPAHAAGAMVKVILENAYLDDDQKVRACRLAEAAGADFVKTSTGFAPTGATHEDLMLMRRARSPPIGVQAAGGGRTLGGLLAVLGVWGTRIGATQTAAILDEFKSRKALAAEAHPSPAG